MGDYRKVKQREMERERQIHRQDQRLQAFLGLTYLVLLAGIAYVLISWAVTIAQ